MNGGQGQSRQKRERVVQTGQEVVQVQGGVLCWEIRLEMWVVPFEEGLELFPRSVSFIPGAADSNWTLQVVMHHDCNSAKERLGGGGTGVGPGVKPARR